MKGLLGVRSLATVVTVGAMLVGRAHPLAAQVALEQEGFQIPPGFLAEWYVLPGFLSVRVLKVKADSVRWSVVFPTSCTTCGLISNRFTDGQDSKEFYFHFRAPTTLQSVVGVKIKVDPSQVRAVVVGRSRVPFVRVADGIKFDAPLVDPALEALPWYDSDDATETYTYIETPGVQIRIEHADIERRRGRYATGPWPEVEHQAALNLEFAAREAIRALGLDRRVDEQGIGTIRVMGFDTNFPTQGPAVAHEDAPPHWHIFVVWSQRPKSRETAHFYIRPDGLLANDTVADDVTLKVVDYKPGETHQTLFPDGSGVLYTDMITPDGVFVIGTLEKTCRLTPIGKGFDSGVNVSCDKYPHARRVYARDDTKSGVLRVFINDDLREEYTYDADTEMLLSSRIKSPMIWAE